MNKTLMTLAVLLSVSAAALADITYAPHAVNLRTDSNTGPLITNGTLVMIFDTNGNGAQATAFPWANWSPSTWNAVSSGASPYTDSGCIQPITNGVGDVQYIFTFTDYVDDGFGNLTPVLPSGYDTSDVYWLIWFDTPYSSTATGPGPGVKFGAKAVGLLAGATSDGALLPTGSVIGDSGKIYYGVTVPEPVTMVLLAIGGGLLAMKRRTPKA
jgi:hypothetical protein